MPTRTVSNTSISGNRYTSLYVEMPTYDIPNTRTFDPYWFPTTTNVRIDGWQADALRETDIQRRTSIWDYSNETISSAFDTEIMRQLEQAAQIIQHRIIGPDIPQPEKFFGATLVPEAKPAFMELRDLIKYIWYTVIGLWWAVPTFNIAKVRADYKWDSPILSDSMMMFNDEAIINDMELEYAKRQFYNIPTQLNGNNQRGSVFQYWYMQ